METTPNGLEGAKVLVMVRVFPDGSGDFAFASKLLSMLIAQGCLPSNIQLVLGVADCDDLLVGEFSKIYERRGSGSLEPMAQRYVKNLCLMYQKIYDTDDGVCTGELRKGRAARRDIDTRAIDDIMEYVEREGDQFPREFVQHYLGRQCFRIGIRNVIKFLLSRPEFNSIKVYVRDTTFLKNGLTPDQLLDFGIDVRLDRYTVITFLIDDVKNYTGVRTLVLKEGGMWSQEERVYAPGFNVETIASRVRGQKGVLESMDLGINMVSYTQVCQEWGEVEPYLGDASVLRLTGGRYHVAYLPLYSKKMSFVQTVSYLRLMSMIEMLEQRRRSGHIVLFLNKEAFDFLCQFQTAVALVGAEGLFPIFKKLGGELAQLDGVMVCSYVSMRHDVFLRFLMDSQPECMVTGDQSFFEALSMGKIALYDAMPHKYGLLTQVLQVFGLLLGKDLIVDERFLQTDISIVVEQQDKFQSVNTYDSHCIENGFDIWSCEGNLFIYKESPKEQPLHFDRAVIVVTKEAIEYYPQNQKINVAASRDCSECVGRAFCFRHPPKFNRPQSSIKLARKQIRDGQQLALDLQRGVLENEALRTKLQRVYKAYDLDANLAILLLEKLRTK